MLRTHTLTVTALLSLASGGSHAAEIGLAVGSKAPEFTLPDQTGTQHSLPELLKKGKVALVFYRSADW